MIRHYIMACDAIAKQAIENGAYEMDPAKSEWISEFAPEYLIGYKEVGRLLSLKDSNTSTSKLPLFAWLEDTEPAMTEDSREWRVHFTLDDSEVLFTDLDSYEDYIVGEASEIKTLQSPGRDPWIQASFWRLDRNKNHVWFEYRR